MTDIYATINQTCSQWLSLGQRKNERILQLTAYLRLVDLECQLCFVMICVLLLQEGQLMEKIIYTDPG